MSAGTNGLAPASPARQRRRRRGGVALVDRWLRDGRRIMEDYPELFVDAVDRVEEEAERFFARAPRGVS